MKMGPCEQGVTDSRPAPRDARTVGDERLELVADLPFRARDACRERVDVPDECSDGRHLKLVVGTVEALARPCPAALPAGQQPPEILRKPGTERLELRAFQ